MNADIKKTNFPSHKNNALKILQFNTSLQKFAIDEVFIYRVLVQ